MMRYSGLNLNDMSAAEGLCVTFFTQGCPHRCSGCHNPDTWDYEGGKEFSFEVLESIITGLTAQGIKRKLCIMGGEPLCPENAFLTNLVISEVKRKLPETQVYIWTGYTYEELINHKPHSSIPSILDKTDCIIDGPYIEELRDITLPMRGSSNQRIIKLKGGVRCD